MPKPRTSKSPKAAPAKKLVRADPWSSTVEEVAESLQVNVATGLTTAQVEALRETHGYNELAKEEGRSFWEMVLEAFDDPLVKILLVAATVSTGIILWESYEANISLSIDRFVEPVVIILILVLNAIIGVYQESSAEASLEALKEMQSKHAAVLRDGEWRPFIEARELVPGDVIRLAVGDLIPADCRLLELRSTTMRVEQMALTGESNTILKQVEPITAGSDAEIQSKVNMLFAGTVVSSGSGTALVTSTGMKTEIGKIQDQIKAATEATREEKTPLKQKLDEFSDQLQNLISGVCVLVWAINVRQFVVVSSVPGMPWVPNPLSIQIKVKQALFYFQIAVALAVAAIPEGLPTVITMCLALGTRKMARRNCIVRQLPAVETLGCTTVICSDKTGTLTTNQMTVRRIVLPGPQSGKSRIFELTGSSYNPRDGASSPAASGEDEAAALLVDICVMCNDADVDVDSKGEVKHVGAPTEAALKVMVEKFMPASSPATNVILPTCKRVETKFKHLTTLEFTRDRKSMSVICRPDDGGDNVLLCKGAPEAVLARCVSVVHKDGSVKKLGEPERKQILAEVEHMANKAWRCLGFAYKSSLGELARYDGPAHKAHKLLSNPASFEQVEDDMIWVGCVGMQDPPRGEVAGAIEACRQAGIRVIVITGDIKQTAEAICRDIGVFGPDEDLSAKSFVGVEFTRLPLAKQRELLWNKEKSGLVFSRAEPKFKQDIVTLLKNGPGNGEPGEVVAMTGDGVNDAPALKMADIGIAMGISGTDVAKGASDMVLADDNFSTIVAAIEEGRSIYSNMKAFIRYMISSNIGEVASIFLTAALGLPEGMISVQLLWVNLVTDGPPATALGFNKAEPNVMQRPPRRADDPLINRWSTFRFLIIGTYVGVATVGIFATWFTQTSLLGLDFGQDGHRPVSLEMLTNWDKCVNGQFVLNSGKHIPFNETITWTAAGPFGSTSVVSKGCEYFGRMGKMKASTLSLSVLVTIEMMNACNALSEDSSLLTVTPLSNPYLLGAITSSFVLHFAVLYIPAISPYFDVVALSWSEWLLVVLFSLPVILIDECLKVVGRYMNAREAAQREAEEESAGASKPSKQKKAKSKKGE